MIATAREAGERIAALEAAGEALRRRPTSDIVAALGAACARWADSADPDRRAGEAALAERYGVPAAAVAHILDAAFRTWTPNALRAWLETELGSAEAVDGFVPLGGTRRRAYGPQLIVSLAAQGVPTTPVGDLLAALLVKAPIWVKPAIDGDELTARFAATVDDLDADLGAAVETAGWPATSDAAAAVLATADTVIVTGRQETLTALRKAVGSDTRLLVHGPRLSIALIFRQALRSAETVDELADDTAFAGQIGCLSPVVAYVETDPAALADLVEPVRRALEARWPAPQRSAGSAAEKAAFGEWVARADVERVTGTGGAWAGDASTGWSVQARPRAEPPAAPPVPRLLVLASVDDGARVAELCERRRGTVATVGVAGPPERVAQLTPELATAGVERVAPLGQMQRPPVAWRRDGRGSLADLVRWVDWEAPTRRAGP